MNVVIVALLLLGSVDATSTRAVAKNNARLLDDSAALLQADGASTALDKLLSVDERDRQLDRERFWRLRAQAHRAVGASAQALRDFQAARGERQKQNRGIDAALNIEVAHLARDVGDFNMCATVLNELTGLNGLSSLDDPTALLQATCLRATPDAARAHEVLAGRHSPAIHALRARMLLEDGAPRAARADVAAVVFELPLSELEAFAGAFATVDPAFAITLGEAAVARFPGDPRASALLLRSSPSLTTGTRALLLDDRANAKAALPPGSQQAQRATLGGAALRARLAELVEQQAWERVRALHPRVKAASYFDDDDVRYAFAFALFATDDLPGAELLLDGVSNPKTFEKASALRAAMYSAQAKNAACASSKTEDPCPR